MAQAIADNAAALGNSCHPKKADFLLFSLMLLAEYIAWIGFATICKGLQRFTTVYNGSHHTN